VNNEREREESGMPKRMEGRNLVSAQTKCRYRSRRTKEKKEKEEKKKNKAINK
jgi:hypothetical protein